MSRQPCSVLLVVALVAGLPAACGEPTAADAAWLHSPASLLQWADGSAAQVGRKHEHEYACLPACMHTGMHTGMHAYRHACRHAYTDAYIHTHPQRPAGVSVESMSMHKHAQACMHAYRRAYRRACIHACMQACIHRCIHTYTTRGLAPRAPAASGGRVADGGVAAEAALAVEAGSRSLGP